MDKEILGTKSRTENLLGDKQPQMTPIVSEWGYVTASLAFIILISVSYFKNIDITSGKIIFAAMLIGQIGYRFFVNRSKTSRLTSSLTVLMIVGLLILLIGFIGELMSNG